MLEVNTITKTFGGVVAVNQCSFSTPAGKITALVGPNGAGKTTLFDIISGLIRPDSGSVRLIHGKKPHIDITHARPDAIANAGVSRTFQHVRLFTHLSLRDHLNMINDNHDTRLFYQLFHWPISPNRDIARHQHDLLEHYGIDTKIDTLVSELSYGQRKLFHIALAVLKPHVLLLLDEPVAGVNLVVQERIEAMLLELKAQGETIVVIEHDMEFVKKLADVVVVLEEGRTLAYGDPHTVLQDPRVLEAYLGE